MSPFINGDHHLGPQIQSLAVCEPQVEQHLVLQGTFGGQLRDFHSKANGVSHFRDLAYKVLSPVVVVDGEVEVLGIVDEVHEALELEIVGDMEEYPAF